MSDKTPVVLLIGLSQKEYDDWNQENSRFNSVTIYAYVSDDHLDQKINKHRPGVIVSISPNGYDSFNALPYMSPQYRKRWIHEAKIDDLQEQQLYNIWYSYIFSTDIRRILTPEDKSRTLVLSAFTTSYKSKHRIQRPYRSLLAQTYNNWEWVIFDDTDPDTPEGKENWDALVKIANSDPRIRIYRSYKNSGIIGEVKAQAAGLCRGDIFIEIDHDDDLVPDLFRWLVDARKEFPNAGFFYSDCCEIFESGKPGGYHGDWGLGYAHHFGDLVDNPVTGKKSWVWAHRTPDINAQTISGLIGLPNHVRAWTRECYYDIGGYNPHLPIVDDFDLMLKTFLKYEIVHIPKMGYLQYSNEGGSNFTKIRNAEIQKHVKGVRNYYHRFISKRIEDCHEKLFGERLSFDQLKDQAYGPWGRDYTWHKEGYCSYPKPKEDSITIIMYDKPPYSNLVKNIEAIYNQSHEHWEIFVIGENDKPMHVDCKLSNLMNELIESANENASNNSKKGKNARKKNRLGKKIDNRLRWWTFEKDHRDSGAHIINHVMRHMLRTKWVTFCGPTQTLIPNIDYLKQFFESLNDTTVSNGYTVCNSIPAIATEGLTPKIGLTPKWGYFVDIQNFEAKRYGYWHDLHVVLAAIDINDKSILIDGNVNININESENSSMNINAITTSSTSSKTTIEFMD
jgi:glycosyltransferase involved in cell wall biosynthesis